MSNELETTPQFQRRMFNKIREQIGDLMSNKDLSALVNTAMHKAFFEETKVYSGGYHNQPAEPPLFVKLIQDQMRDIVKIEVSKWVQDNPDIIKAALNEALEKGMFNMALSYFEQKTQYPLQEMTHKLMSKGIL